MGLSVSNSTVFIPEVAADAVNTAIEGGLPVMFAGRAFVANPGLPRQQANGADFLPGDKIVVPYWSTLGKFEAVPEGHALKPKEIAQTSEEAVYQRFGVFFSQSRWNSLVKRFDDPYQQIVMAVPKMMAATLDDVIAENLFTTIPAIESAKYVHTVPANGTITWPDAVVARFKMGDELDGMNMGVISSKVASDLFQLADGNDRPLMLGGANPGGVTSGPTQEFTFMGTQFRVSDRKTKIANTSPADYYTAFLKDGTGAVWYSDVEVMEDIDAKAGTKGWSFWFYAAVHTYKRREDSTKPGAVLLKSR